MERDKIQVLKRTGHFTGADVFINGIQINNITSVEHIIDPKNSYVTITIYDPDYTVKDKDNG